MEAKILKYHVKNSMKRTLIIGNGTPRACIAIHLDKTFRVDDAKVLVDLVNRGKLS